MTTTTFTDLITDESQLRDVFGWPSARSVNKQIDHLDQHCRAIIAKSPFLLLGTSDPTGRCDVSPKGDYPGFVRVLDDTHLAIPDRIGNNRLDGMRNILQNPHIGMILLIPGREDTLRINGKAWIVEDAEILDGMTVQGKRPPFAIGVEVEEAYMHCPRAFMRSGLWKPERWPDPEAVVSMARIMWDQVPDKGGFACVEDYEADRKEKLQTLY